MFFTRDIPEITPKESWKTKRWKSMYQIYCKRELSYRQTDLRTKALTSLRKSLFNDKRFNLPKLIFS